MPLIEEPHQVLVHLVGLFARVDLARFPCLDLPGLWVTKDAFGQRELDARSHCLPHLTSDPGQYVVHTELPGRHNP